MSVARAMLVNLDELALRVVLSQFNRVLVAGTALAVTSPLIVFLVGARNFTANLAKGFARDWTVIKRMALYFRN